MHELMPRTLHDTAPLFEQHEERASRCRQRRTDQSHKHTSSIFIDDEHFHSQSRVLVAFSLTSLGSTALGVGDTRVSPPFTMRSPTRSHRHQQIRA